MNSVGVDTDMTTANIVSPACSECAKHRTRIFVAIPNQGTLVPRLTFALLAWSHDPELSLRISMPECIHPLSSARNFLVREFLASDCEYLFWVDSDVVPPTNALRRMLATIQARPEINALSAVCFCMRVSDDGVYYPYPVTFLSDDVGGYKVYTGRGIERVDATGGGCLLVERQVYEKIEAPAYEFIFDKHGALTLTCDFLLWRKARTKNLNIYVDFDILCDHQRTVSIKGVQDFCAAIAASKPKAG